MDDQAFQLIVNQLQTLNMKVDELVAFKFYFIGVAAAVSTVVSGVAVVVSKVFFS